MKHTICALLLIGLGACGPKFHHPTPNGFVKLEDQYNYDYRAVTADGLVLAARAIRHKPKGEIGFWKKAVVNQMRQRGGYALLGEKDVKTRSGLDGVQLRFGHDESRTPHLYYVTLFVTEDTIFLLEAGGSKKQVEESTAQIDEAVAGFRIN